MDIEPDEAQEMPIPDAAAIGPAVDADALPHEVFRSPDRSVLADIQVRAVKLRNGNIGRPTWLRSPLSIRIKWPAIDCSPPCTSGSCSARRSISARAGHEPRLPSSSVKSIPFGFTSPPASGMSRE